MSKNGVPSSAQRLPRVNFRPLLFAAAGISSGIFFYCRIRFGGLVPSDFLFLLCFLPFAVFPVSKRKIIALICLFFGFAAVGTAGIHVYAENFLSGKAEGEYGVEGTVTLICIRDGYTEAELSDVRLGGEKVAGKLSLSLPSEDIRPGDRISFTAKVSRVSLPSGTEDAYDFAGNIRYHATAETYGTAEKGFHPLLFLNAKLFDLMREHMGGEEGYIAYALLTGNSRMVDRGFMTAVRSGGIAHIFAVSGLHIGILYGAALTVFKFLKKYSAIPAVVLCTLYCALCGWSVSALRALIMCIVLSINTFTGRKPDMLNSVSAAAVAVLLVMPAQWLSAGFRLSFGACLGLALFAGMFTRGMKRAHIPRFLREYLAAGLAVQLFTFPILMECFGYFSVWGIGLNLFIVPLLPAAFLTLLFCTLFSLLIPPAASFFLMFPGGLFSLLLYLFAAADFGYVLTGFAFGSAGTVWLCACFYGTERVRLRPSVRIAVTCFAVFLFSLCLVAENCLFGGAVVDVGAGEDGMLALVRCGDESVLIVGDGASLKDCEDFLNRRTGRIGAAVVLSDDRTETLNIAAFTGAERIYCMREGADGFHETEVICGERFTEGELSFSFETDGTLLLFVRGNAVMFDIDGFSQINADLSFANGCGTLKYFLDYGIILSL